MDKLTRLISKADFVGIQLKPTLNGANRIKSFFGGVISILVTGCILFGFVYFGISMVTRNKPIMNVVQRMESNAIILAKDNPLSMLAFDRYGRTIHANPEFQRAINLEIQLYRIRPDPDRIFTIEIFTGKTKFCDRSVMSEKVYNEMMGIGMNPEMSICGDMSSLVNSKGEPYEGEAYYQNRYADITSDYIYYKFKHCDEEKDPGCGDFLKKTGRINVNFYRMDYYIDPTDFENPVKPNVIQIGYSPNKTVSQSVYIPTRINEIVTDKSMFLSEEAKETYYSAINPTVNIRPYEENEKLLLEFVASVEKIVTINQRRYLKIPELLANMGGFMKAAMAIGNLLAYLNSDYIYYLTVRKVELNYKDSRTISSAGFDVSSDVKSSSSPIKIKGKKTKLPSFREYLVSLFKKKKRENLKRNETFKYLELNYLIERLLVIEEIKETRLNNLIEQK